MEEEEVQNETNQEYGLEQDDDDEEIQYEIFYKKDDIKTALSAQAHDVFSDIMVNAK